MLTAAAVALTLLIGHGASAQNRNGGRFGQYDSQDAREHGYEHGYRDGADRGRQDRERATGRNFRDNDYLTGARDYDPSFGNRREYMSGYREGYEAGYDDGYNYYERPGRYGELYGRRSRSGGSADSAFDAGYREGIAAGQYDQRENIRSDFRRADAYRRGNEDFRDGFERGYQDGYGRSRYSSDGGGYFPNRGTTGPADTRDGEGTPSRTIVVPGNRQWTPTGIRVSQGDPLRIETTGQIQLKPNDAKDVARSAGSLIQRYAPGAPLPNAFAGALIGRIDSGQPFGIGDQTSIVAPASGLLYLGINDDAVSDNSGQFQVVISW